jgi:ferredoxin-NADP reductase
MSLTQSLLRSPVVSALSSPHGIDRYLELVNPMWAAHEVRARVLDIRRETSPADGAPVATLLLQPTSTWQGFRAGQYVQVGVEVDGARRTTRCFSISSGEAGPGEPFTLTLRANPDGVVSDYLVNRARPGELLHLSQAEGRFTLPDPLPPRLLFISGGSGITPVMSMTRTLTERGYDGRITFLHYAQSAAHQIYDLELAALDQHADNVDVHLVYPETDGDFFTAERLAALVPDHREVDTWACGPAGLIELVQRAYDDTDDTERPSRLRVEYFKTPVFSTGSAEGAISFSRSGTSAENSAGTLLEQAEAAGLTPAFGCRMGICFSCTARKTEGTVRHVVTGAESSRPDEDIQVCVSQPVGSCAVDL